MSDLVYHAGATGYDQLFARTTRLFIPALLRTARVAPGHRVLDIATGTGLAAEAAAAAVGPSGYVVAGDISLPMLDKARRNLKGLSVGLAAMDGQLLPCPDGSFDAVICQLGLMFFPDPAGGLSEFRRVLRAGGYVAVSATPTPERSLYGRAGVVIARYLPSRAEVLNRYFAMGDAGQLRALLDGAGFRDVEVKSERRQIVFGSFDDYFRGIEQGAGLAGQEYVTLPDKARRAVREELQQSLAAAEADRRLAIEMEVLIGGGLR